MQKAAERRLCAGDCVGSVTIPNKLTNEMKAIKTNLILRANQMYIRWDAEGCVKVFL